jgi:hypothetical protein
LEALVTDILYLMENGTTLSKRIATLIREGKRTLRLYAGSTYFSDPKFDSRTRNAFGYWSASEPTHINLNIEKIRRTSGGGYKPLSAASTVVHEGTHSLGLGELSAFCGQALFLISTLSPRVQKTAARGIILTDEQLPGLLSGHRTLVRTFSIAAHAGKIALEMTEFIHFMRGYEKGHLRLQGSVTPDKWVIQMGGVEAVLGITDVTIGMAEKAYWKALGDQDFRAKQEKAGFRMGMP